MRYLLPLTRGERDEGWFRWLPKDLGFVEPRARGIDYGSPSLPIFHHVVASNRHGVYDCHDSLFQFSLSGLTTTYYACYTLSAFVLDDLLASGVGGGVNALEDMVGLCPVSVD